LVVLVVHAHLDPAERAVVVGRLVHGASLSSVAEASALASVP
jgi:hypothetical protein